MRERWPAKGELKASRTGRPRLLRRKMRLQYRLAFKELLDLNYYSRYQRCRGAIVVAMGVGMIALGVWMFVSRGDRDPTVLFVSGAGFVLLGFLVPWIAGLGAWLLGRAPKIDLDVKPEGIQYTDAQGGFFIPWERFTRTYVTRRLLILELGWTDALAVPSRCCEPAMWTDVLKWARTKGNPK
jgi:hypothetical protein